MFTQKRSAFTLIELLIVVAIIAILAAIAVPNFLEAQTRAKVSRTKADMRSIATAIESYAVDFNRPHIGMDEAGTLTPPFWGLVDPGSPIEARIAYFRARKNREWSQITTPVAYMTSVPVDVFQKATGAYLFVSAYERFQFRSFVGWPGPVPSNPNHRNQIYFEAAQINNTAWHMFSWGPNASSAMRPFLQYGRHPYKTNGGMDPEQQREYAYNSTYDPTNGTMSVGHIYRTNLGQMVLPF
jgi:prepilin-type N-terminal cleavage/methylation domain-containing protein